MPYLKRSILALRTLFFVLMASLVVFVTTTSLGAIHERDRILALAHGGARTAVEQNLPAMAVALWNYDNASLEALLRGLTRAGTISRLEILDGQAVVADIGRSPGAAVDQVWTADIRAPAGGKIIGSLRVSESHAEAHELIRSALETLVITELIKIIGLTTILFVIVYRQIARHLSDLARDVATLAATDPDAALALKRPGSRHPDELDSLVTAINRFHRERAEEMLKRALAEENLRERMAEIEVVLGSLADGVIALDRECRIRHANGAAQTLLGLKDDLGQGTALAGILALVGGGEGDITARLCRRVLADGAPVHRRGDVLVQTRDGRKFDARISLVPVPAGGEVAMILVFTDISAEIGKERQIEFQAFHDPLTELGNRSLLARDLAREIGAAAGEGGRVALLCLDLDNFKNINDALGHAIGDILLMQLAERLGQVVPAPGWVTRHGGDEFIVVLPRVAAEGEASALAEAIMAAIAQPFHIEGNELRITSSIGISIYPDHGLTQGELISNADMAMYEAKRAGRNGCRFYEPVQLERSSERLAMENGLRVALEEGELSLVFQPKVRLPGHHADAVEALLRWHSRRQGSVSPATFIPLAEETGLIIDIGEWVLRESLAAARRLRAALGREVAVAVNVSPVQFRSEGLIDTLRQLARQEPDLPRLLEIELTEQALAGNIAEVTGKLQEIKDLGLKIAIDDFGTGYSSLAYLKNFPVDILKIDQAFIRGLHASSQDRAIVGSIVRLGKSLGFELVAEGVEEEAHVSILEELACDYAQGYWFARPLAEDRLVERLRELAPEACINPS